MITSEFRGFKTDKSENKSSKESLVESKTKDYP